MKKIILPFIIIAAAVVGSMMLAKLRPEPEQSEETQSALLVDVMSVQVEDAYFSIASQGTVEPRTRTNLVSEVSGQVIEVSPVFVVGGFFRQGDVLLSLDNQNYKAAVSRNEAAVASSKSQLAQEEGQGDVAQREWERMSTERQAQVKAKGLYLRKPQLEEALSRLAASEADLEQSLNDLRKTQIIAPYDGLVSVKSTDIGQFVSSGSTIGEIFAIDYAEVRLPIPETKIQYLDLPPVITDPRNVQAYGAKSNRPDVEIYSRQGDLEDRWLGQMTRTEGVLDTNTRVLFSVVQIEDPYGLIRGDNADPLRIGTYVNASIQGKLLENVIILPRHTVLANNIVWVADPENRLQAREVQVVAVNGDNVYISSGLEAGDQVVITRLENPLNATRVQTRSQ